MFSGSQGLKEEILLAKPSGLGEWLLGLLSPLCSCLLSALVPASMVHIFPSRHQFSFVCLTEHGALSPHISPAHLSICKTSVHPLGPSPAVLLMKMCLSSVSPGETLSFNSPPTLTQACYSTCTQGNCHTSLSWQPGQAKDMTCFLFISAPFSLLGKTAIQ